MNHARSIGLAAVGLLVAGVAASAWLRADRGAAVAKAAAIKPEAVLLHAQRFELEQPYTHHWRREQPKYDGGWLLVIEAEPELLRVSQVQMPVLYVGAQTAERINLGNESGRVVVLAPGDFELTDAPIYFGTPGLPERIGIDEIDHELGLARQRDVAAPTAADMATVLQDTVRVRTEWELRQLAVDLVERFSPVEQDFVRGMRIPLGK